MRRPAILAVAGLVAVALAAAGGSAALPGNGRIVLAHDDAYWLANPDGTNPQPLASGLTFSGQVMWSPDGAHLTFAASDGERMRAYVVDADGTDLHVLLDDASRLFFPHCWLPTGEIVLTSSTGDPAAVDLWLVRADGTGLRRLTADGAPKRLSNQPCASDGSRIAYSAGGDYPFTAYWIATSDGERVRLTPEGSSDEPPTLSPDGLYAAITRGRPGPVEGEGVSVLRVDLETGTTIPLSTTTPGNAEALWSPDGTRLVLSAVRYEWPPGSRFPHVFGELSLLTPDGSSERTLTRPPAGQHPYDFLASWSPDGERIVFLENGLMTEPATRVMNADDGTCRRTIAQTPDYIFVAGGWQPLPGAPAASPLECADLRVDGEADRALLTIGEALTLRARVENQGNRPASQVVVSGGEVAHLRPVSISAGTGSCSRKQTRCELGTLQPSESVEVTMSLRSTFSEPPTGSSWVTFPLEVSASGEINLGDNGLTTEFQAWACTKLASPTGSLVAGTPRADILCGHVGSDRVIGRSGNDIVSARSGNDRVEGGPGRDRLDGGPGWDTLLGGSGRDALLVRDGSRDVVDCGPGEDAAVADRLDRLRHCEHVRRR